jgi:hypothetical protein
MGWEGEEHPPAVIAIEIPSRMGRIVFFMISDFWLGDYSDTRK